MRRKHFYLLLFLLAWIYSVGQNNLIKGYILLSKTDTLYGELNGGTYYQNSLYCDFKSINSDSIQRYLPSEIDGYRFLDGKFYITRDVFLNGKDSTFFMEFIIDGELDIYFIQDNHKTNHYFASKDGLPLKELQYSNKMLYIDGKYYEKETQKYIGVLNTLTKDCPELEEDIIRLKKPNHKKIIRFSEKYHNIVCTENECIIFEKKVPKQIHLELASGYKHMVGWTEEYENSGSPYLGFNFYFNNPRFSENGFFGVGFIYDGTYTNKSTGIKESFFRLPLTYGYIKPGKGVQPLIFGGINFNNYVSINTVSIIPGLKIDINKFFLKFYADFEFYSFGIIPVYISSTSLGLNLSYIISYQKQYRKRKKKS